MAIGVNDTAPLANCRTLKDKALGMIHKDVRT